MAPDKNDFVSTRERLEFLLDNENTSKSTARQGNSTRQAFLSGAAFSGLIAGSIFLTHFIDSKLQQSSATEDSSASATMAGVVAAAGSAGANAPAGSAVDVAAKVSALPSSTMEAATTRGRPIEWNRTDSVDPRNSLRRVSMNTIVPMSPHPIPAAITPVSIGQPTTTQTTTPLSPVAGLSTQRSVITGVADPQTLTASYYWTFSLKNTSSSSKEAQMNIALPDGAVVSRATLWINGKAEEAAFNSTWAVQNAYDWIVSRHRDPLVITQTENNKISLKASPVMPNKEMKIRIGMTVPMKMSANGQCQMELPHLLDTNLNTSCVQNVHITSDAPIFANDTHMTSAPRKKGYLLRGNLASTDLSKLQVTMKRDAQIKRFATRATHSMPAAYILAELQQDEQDLNRLKLTKVIEKPDCPIVADEHAAFRLSYLWAKEEINRLMNSNESDQAVQLATVYRVVSQVSGAVVLERQSDYDYNGLDRNMYKSMAYVGKDSESPQNAAQQQSAGYAPAEAARADDFRTVDAMPMAAMPSPTPKAGFAPSPSFDKAMPSVAAQPRITRRRAQHKSEANGLDKGKSIPVSMIAPQTKPMAEKKSIDARKSTANSVSMPVTQKLASADATTASADAPVVLNKNTGSIRGTNSSGTPQVMNQSNSDRVVRLAGPVASWLQHTNLLTGSEAVATALLLSCLGLTFAGGLGLLALALVKFCQHKPGAMQYTAAGLTWLVMASFWPLFSQVVFVVFGTTFLFQTGFRVMKPLIHR